MRDRARALAAAFLALFSIVGFALYGLPFFYDFFVQDLGWTRRQVTSGNAISKVVVGPVFGFLAGLIIDRFGARRLMLAGIVMAGAAVVGLSTITTPGGFYVFYFLNALGYVCGGPRSRASGGGLAAACADAAGVLAARDREHDVDRRHRRHDAEPEAVSEPRPPPRSGRRRRHSVAAARRQPRRTHHDGMAGRPL